MAYVSKGTPISFLTYLSRTKQWTVLIVIFGFMLNENDSVSFNMQSGHTEVAGICPRKTDSIRCKSVASQSCCSFVRFLIFNKTSLIAVSFPLTGVWADAKMLGAVTREEDHLQASDRGAHHSSTARPTAAAAAATKQPTNFLRRLQWSWLCLPVWMQMEILTPAPSFRSASARAALL